MHVANIKYNDIANGLGVRTTLFVSGCTNRCKGCFQPETWDFNYGELYTSEIEDKIIESLKIPWCDGLTILGGEPFEPSNQQVLVGLINRVKQELPDKNIWMFTGFKYENLLKENHHRVYIDGITDFILKNIDVLVDGPFIQEERDISLKFRGSRNQRLINMKKTLKSKRGVILLDL